jgi:hypothetical protein
VTSDVVTAVREADAQYDEAAIREQVESLDPGPAALTEDLRTLNRYLRRRLHLESELATVKAQAAAMAAAIESDLRGLDYFYLARVRDITANLIAGRGRKSFKTLFGTVGFRSTPARVSIEDEAALLAFAEASAELRPAVQVRKTVPARAVNDYFNATGDVPPGTLLHGPGESFTVSTKPKE